MTTKNIFLFLFLNWFCTTIICAQIDTLVVYSPSMNKNIPNIIITPENYTKKGKKMSVLYLLHGAGGDYTHWLSNVSLEQYANEFEIIIVCPDGGNTSWYFDSPIDPTMNYETYISKELIAVVDKKYNTIPKKNNRAITGLSMGGHGALYLALKHQNIWGAAGSMSGGVDIRPFSNNWDINKRLGAYSEHLENWKKNTVINLVHLWKGELKIIFDCGYDDFFFDVNKNLHEKLVKMNIPHDYIIRPGNHNWAYWSNAIQYQLIFFGNFFKK